VSFFNIGNFGNGPERLLNVLPQQFEGIQAATRVNRQRDIPMVAGDQTFREPTVFYTDSSFFKVFSYEFIAGDPAKVLRAPNEIVLTASTAMKYFGSTNVVGRSILVRNERKEFFVSGVVKDLEFNTTVKSPVFLSINEMLKGDENWSSASFYNFFLVNENITQTDVQAAIDRLIENNVFPETGKNMGLNTLSEFIASPNSVKLHLHALPDVYLKSELGFELVPGGSESNIYIFSAISLFILALAAVNFINLTTARASRRAKEVGIRKTMGTSRGKLVTQFLSESVLISIIAMVAALVLAELFLVAFTYVTGTPLLTTIWKNPATVLLFALFSIAVGICAGLYPAFYLTAFNPVRVLKGNVSSRGGAGFRNFLVVFQFAVSMILIVCAIVVQQQLHFVQTKELGFDQNNILTIERGNLLDAGKAQAFKDELDSHAGVIKSSFHGGEPGSKRFMAFFMFQTADMPEAMSMNTYLGDANFIDVMGIRLLRGRNFNKDLASDTAAIILNESAVAALGLPEDPIGAVINKTGKVVGVVSDFHWESLHNNIGPTAIISRKRNLNEISFKLEQGQVRNFMATAEKKWKELVPNEPFMYHFVDGNFADLLEKDKVFGKAINFFTLLAIFISCLGLYGLSAYTAEQRTREIGIRKVLGATSSEIVLMLNRKFTMLVTVAIVVSIPLATWLISQWLDGFAYKISPGAGVFVLSVAIALFTAWLTVSFHSVRASWVNPSEALKYE
jgi:putative ABC transport system permease protein